jgi:5S rRNA maturation endonuclease (ribonuclease M5)
MLKMLGISAYDISSDWVQVNCPLAFLNHAGQRDSKPSCGISFGDTESYVHCFTCGTRSLGDLLFVLNWHGKVQDDALRFYLNHEILEETAPEVTYKEKFYMPETKAVPIPSEVFDNFDSIVLAETYLKQRGIDLEIAERYGLMYCKEFKTEKGGVWQNAIVCPIRDLDYNAYWVHFRSIQDKRFWHGKPEHFGLVEPWGREDSWFGMEFLDMNSPIWLVEGIFDCLRLKTLGVSNVLAAHGGIGKRSKKIMRINEMNPKLVYLGFDADKAGKTFSIVAKRQLSCPTIDLDWSKAGVKDPGDLKSQEDLLKVLNQEKELEFNDKFERKSIYESV